MLVIGDKEVENNTVAPRHRRAGNMQAMPPRQFINEIESEIAEKR